MVDILLQNSTMYICIQLYTFCMQFQPWITNYIQAYIIFIFNNKHICNIFIQLQPGLTYSYSTQKFYILIQKLKLILFQLQESDKFVQAVYPFNWYYVLFNKRAGVFY
jgi:hypothetical protein